MALGCVQPLEIGGKPLYDRAMRARAKPMISDRPELRKRPANFVQLNPASFLARAAAFFGDRVGVIHGERSISRWVGEAA